MQQDQAKEAKKATLKNAICRVIDEMPAGTQFYGWELKERVVAVYPDCLHSYIDTILRQVRKYRRYSVLCINNTKSLYEKTADR